MMDNHLEIQSGISAQKIRPIRLDLKNHPWDSVIQRTTVTFQVESKDL
jgi:hypothetical protein